MSVTSTNLNMTEKNDATVAVLRFGVYPTRILSPSLSLTHTYITLHVLSLSLCCIAVVILLKISPKKANTRHVWLTADFVSGIYIYIMLILTCINTGNYQLTQTLDKQTDWCLQSAGGNRQAGGGRAGTVQQTGSRADGRSPQQAGVPPHPVPRALTAAVRGGHQVWRTDRCRVSQLFALLAVLYAHPFLLPRTFRWRELPQVEFLLRQKLLSQQTRVWRDKSKLVAAKVWLSWQNFFAFVLLSSGADHNKKQTWGVFSCVCVCHSVSRYNGHLTAGDKGRRRSKYILWKRTRSNGVKPSKRHLVSDPKSSKVNCLLLLVCWSPPHHHYHQHSHLHPFQEVVWPSG